MKISTDKADAIFSQYIRLRDKSCQRCGSLVKLNDKGDPISHQASHFQGRRKEATRFDPLNVDTLCFHCHQYFTANPAEHYMWQVDKKGLTTVNEIVIRSNSYKKKDRSFDALIWGQAYRDLKSEA